MQNVQENISDLETILQEVSNHPMCYNLEEVSGGYIIIFPNEVNGLSGIRVVQNLSKFKTLTIILEKLEEYWKLDNPALYP